MRLILDTNEFIFALTLGENHPAFDLLNTIAQAFPDITVHIPRTIVKETRNNLSKELFKKFLSLIPLIGSIDEDTVVPVELVDKYLAINLKPSDAFIAAYTDWIRADMIVSENRHFLARRTNLSFKVVTAFECLKLIKT